MTHIINQSEFFQALRGFSEEAKNALYNYYAARDENPPKTVRDVQAIAGLWTEYASLDDYNSTRTARHKPTLKAWKNVPEFLLTLPGGGAVILAEK